MHTIALACNLLATFLVAAFGLMYALRQEFMPYHAAALGLRWEQLEPPFKALILALMRAIAGLCFAVVFLLLVLLLVPFRQGAAWALLAVPVGGMLVTCASIYGMAYVARRTPANPPWILPIAGGSLFLAALCLVI